MKRGFCFVREIAFFFVVFFFRKKEHLRCCAETIFVVIVLRNTKRLVENSKLKMMCTMAAKEQPSTTIRFICIHMRLFTACNCIWREKYTFNKIEACNALYIRQMTWMLSNINLVIPTKAIMVRAVVTEKREKVQHLLVLWLWQCIRVMATQTSLLWTI